MRMGSAILGEGYQLAQPRTKKMDHVQRSVKNEIIKHDSPEDYEIVACICGNSSDYEVLSEVERHGLPYRKVICKQCGLLRVSPRWKEEKYNYFYEHYYRNLYNPLKTTKEKYIISLSQHANVKAIAKWVIESHRSFGSKKNNPSILEIGAGGGWILKNLPMEWKKTGFDVDNEYLKIGHRLFGIEMKYGFFKEAVREIENHDIILLSHVVEHFLNPVSSLRLISENMKSDSIVLIEVPGIFRIHRTNLDPMSYMQNAHTYTFCAKTLKYVCEMAGLEVMLINEHCRAICRKQPDTENLEPTLIHENLADSIIEYLKRCDNFYLKYLKVNRFGRLAGYLYRKLFAINSRG
jgi:2-polyprenyl-3-methyl-5-hydroxy-6-metoxy-1,4-benzoquinol methylase